VETPIALCHEGREFTGESQLFQVHRHVYRPRGEDQHRGRVWGFLNDTTERVAGGLAFHLPPQSTWVKCSILVPLNAVFVDFCDRSRYLDSGHESVVSFDFTIAYRIVEIRKQIITNGQEGHAEYVLNVRITSTLFSISLSSCQSIV
jgi:hypothetical protein